MSRDPGARLSRRAICALLAAFVAGPETHAAPVTIGGPFNLTTVDGQAVTDQTFRGKWLLVYFGFTHCPVACPTALLEVAAALKDLGADADAVQPLFITVDPRRDTSAVIRDYVSSFDSRIVGLTGTPPQIEAAAQEYGVYAIRQPTGPGEDDYTIDHSTYLYLMAPDGRFVRGFDNEASGAHIAGALRALMKRAGDGRGG